jgi:hypothetical protein
VVCALLGLSAIWASPSPATAQTAPTPPARDSDGASQTAVDDQATAHYQRARQLLDDQRASEALVEIDASLALLPSANSELLRAHALRELGRRAEALAAYQRAIDGASARVRAGEERFKRTLSESGRWAALLRAELGELVVDLGAAPAGTTVQVDGFAVPIVADARGAWTARLWHEPGEVRVGAQGPSGRSRSAVVKLAAGRVTQVSLTLVDVAPAPATAAPDRGPPLASWVAAGIGVAGVGAFAITALLAESEDAELDHCSPSCVDPTLRPHEERRDRYATIANVSLAIGAAGLVTAGVVWFVSARSAPTTVAMGPGRLSVRAAF